MCFSVFFFVFFVFHFFVSFSFSFSFFTRVIKICFLASIAARILVTFLVSRLGEVPPCKPLFSFSFFDMFFFVVVVVFFHFFMFGKSFLNYSVFLTNGCFPSFLIC